MVLATLLVVELGLRIVQRVQAGTPIFRFGPSAPVAGIAPSSLPVVSDAETGWAPNPGYHFVGEVSDADGRRRQIEVTQGPHGLRSYGGDKPRRILVIGDSFTQALCVDDHDTYYARIAKATDSQVFAAAAAGWGTLQESQYLSRILADIKPDLILWQMAYNDFMDNDFELGKSWKSGCISSVRPYWKPSGIEYRYSCHGAWATIFRLGYLLVTRLDKLTAPKEDLLVRQIVQQQAHPGFAAAVATTSSIFDDVAHKVGNTPVILFLIDSEAAPFSTAARKLATDHKFGFVENVPLYLGRLRRVHATVECADGVHLNDEGHRIVAKALLETLPP